MTSFTSLEVCVLVAVVNLHPVAHEITQKQHQVGTNIENAFTFILYIQISQLSKHEKEGCYRHAIDNHI